MTSISVSDVLLIPLSSFFFCPSCILLPPLSAPVPHSASGRFLFTTLLFCILILHTLGFVLFPLFLALVSPSISKGVIQNARALLCLLVLKSPIRLPVCVHKGIVDDTKIPKEGAASIYKYSFLLIRSLSMSLT